MRSAWCRQMPRNEPPLASDRRIILTIASLVLMLTAPQLVRAATETVSIGSGGADGELGAEFFRFVSGDGVPDAWTASTRGECHVGGTESPAGDDVERRDEWRFALEFPLAALPDDATVTAATLEMVGEGDNLQVAIYGYAGDGAITSPDVDVSGTPVLVEPHFDPVRLFHDVTELLTAEVIAAGWAGFSIRQEPLGPNQPYRFFCPLEVRERGGDLFPILTIEYSLPDPEPTLVPTPAAADLPNTATSLMRPTDGWAAITVGALLFPTVVWTARGRRGSRVIRQ